MTGDDMKKLVPLCAIVAVAFVGGVQADVVDFVPGTTEGPVVLGQTDILRYTGAQAATTDLVFTNNAASWTGSKTLSFTSMFDLRQDLTFTKQIWSGWTGFLKVGPGAMIIDGATVELNQGLDNNTSRTSYTVQMELPADGSVPAKGFCGFTLAEGSLVLNNGSVSIPTHAAYANIGGRLAGAGEQEPDALFEQNGGTANVNATLIIGQNKGLVSTTPNGPATSTLRVNDGTFTLSGGKYLFVGPSSTPDNEVYNNRSRFEVHGGTVNLNNTKWELRIYGISGCDSLVWVDGGVVNATKAAAGFVTSYGSAKTGVAVGRQQFVVCSNGVFKTTVGVTGYNKDSKSPTEITVFDGGQFLFNALLNDHPTKTTTTITVDGGVLGSYSNAAYAGGTNWLMSAGMDVQIGAKGAVLAIGQSVARRVEVPFRTQDGLTSDGGVVVSNAANGVVEYAAAMAYNGPTVVKGGYLSLVDAGTVPGNAVTLTEGGLLVRETGHAIGTLTLGEDGRSTNPKLKVAEGTPLVVTESLVLAGTPRLSVALVDADGVDLAETREGVTVLTAPAAARADLENLDLDVTAASATTAFQKRVVVSGETCSLVVDTCKSLRVNAKWMNSKGGNWNDGANWEGGEVPLSAPGVTVTFATKSTGTNTAVRIDGTVTLGCIDFQNSNPGYRITGGTLVFDNNGNGCTVNCKTCRNRIDSNLVLNEDLSITGADAMARRLTLAGLQTGVGRVLMPDAVRLAFAGTGMAPTAEMFVVPKGKTYFYTTRDDAVGEGDNRAMIGGMTLNGKDEVVFVVYDDGRLVVTNGIQLSRDAGAQQVTVSKQDGEFWHGLPTDPIGEGPRSYLHYFEVDGTARLNSGVLSYYSFRNGDNTGTVFFDGTVLSPRRTKSGDTIIRDAGNYYLGARGLIIDTSEYTLPTATETSVAGATYSSTLKVPFQRDPALAEGVCDGGITVTGGRGRILLNGDFGGDWSGPLTMKPGTGLFLDKDLLAVQNLVLGEAGAADFIEIGMRSDATSLTGLVVSNALSILSPVRCVTYEAPSSLSPTYADGASYAILTYPSTQADPDLALFKRDIRIPSARATYSVVTVAAGDYAGWRQVRMTIATGSNLEDARWTATSTGGAWNESANWNGGVPPNDRTAYALFNPAAAANVPVTLNEKKSVGILDVLAPVDTAYGYAFSGAALTAQILQVPFGKASFSELEASGDMTVSTTNGSSTTVTAKLTGSGQVTLNADKYKLGGQHTFDTTAFNGRLKTGSGTTTVNDLGFVKSIDDLVLSTGTLYFQPGDSAPAETEIAGFTVTGNSNYKYTSAILRVQTGKTLTIRGATSSGNCGFNLRGSGTLRLKGNGSFAFGTQDITSGTGSDSSDTQSGAGDGPRSAVRAFSIGNGKVVIGTKDDPEDAPNVTTGNDLALLTRINTSSMTAPSLEMNNGTLTGGIFYPSYKNNIKREAPYYANFNGGRVAFAEQVVCHEAGSPVVVRVNGGTFSSSNIYMANSKGGYGRMTFEQNGGQSTFSNMTFVSTTSYTSVDPISVVINGGTLVCRGDLDLCRGKNNLNGVIELRLNGGELRYGELMMTAEADYFANGLPRLYLGGGVMKPQKPATVDIAPLEIYASTNATTLSTADYASGDYVIANVIAHDPALSAADGGLIKVGANDLVLTAANTFTGPLVVQEGAVRLAGNGSIVGALALDGTTLVAPNGVSVAGLYGSGVVDGSVATPMMRPGRVDEAAFAVAGDLALAPEFTLDLADVADRVKVGDSIPLCRVEGTIGALPGTVKLLNMPTSEEGQTAVASLSVENKILYARFSRTGMMFIIR